MTKINLYAAFPGVKDGLTLCTLLQNKKKLKEVMGVIQILDDRTRKINESIEVLGKASKMDALLREANQKNQDATFALDQAKEEAGRIQRDAKSWADDLRSKIIEREKKLGDGEKKLAGDISQHISIQNTLQADLAKREAKVAEREKTTVRLLDDAKTLKKRHETGLASMKAGVAAA